jgi:hypothetical protein
MFATTLFDPLPRLNERILCAPAALAVHRRPQ